MVTLREMDEAEFDAFLAASLADFVADLSRGAALTPEQAAERARTLLDEMLPEGRDTLGNAFLAILDDGAAVGRLWLGPHRDRSDAAYVYDIAVDEGLRGRGIGRAALLAADDWARSVGFVAIGLSVFGFNADAQRLYASAGYEVVATEMLKTLEP
jgi:GNAT superfamily N-acetyltransferase